VTTISPEDPRAVAVVAAIHVGDADRLRALLAADPGLARTRLGDDHPDGMSRSLLHVATDWPGHFPHVAATIAVLVAAGADVDARFHGPHHETPLHWAASSDDLDALHALLDAGADIDAEGGVIAGGTSLRDATAFGQWRAAHALVERGASATPFDLAALGMTDALMAALDGLGPGADELDQCFWSACHGGQLVTAQTLADRGADLDWLPGWEQATPLDIAARSQAHDVVRWLHSRGARTCDQVTAPGAG
jgi:ankyrin repeat protein